MSILNIVKAEWLLLATVCVCAAKMPEGSSVNWNLQNAWRTASAARERICVNGVWQWRSESREVKKTATTTYHWSETYDESVTDKWSIIEVDGARSTLSLDRDVTCDGTPSLRFETDIPIAMNYYFVRYPLSGWKTLCWQNVEFDVLSQLEGSPVHFELRDARGFRFFTSKSAPIPKSDSWRHVTMRIQVPAGCEKLNLIALRTEGPEKRIHGKLWMTNLRVGDVPVPTVAAVPPPTDDAWGDAIVPNFSVPSLNHPLCWPHETDAMARQPEKASAAWFRRDVEVPPSWIGRRIILHFNALATDAFVYCNGEFAGQLGFDGGDVDVTKWAVPGKAFTVSILIVHRQSTEYLPLLTTVDSRWQTIGINGDVYLDSTPIGVTLGDCRIVTAVTPEKNLSVTVPLHVPNGEDTTGLSWRCRVVDDDRVLLDMKGNLPADATAIAVQAPLPEAVCWDVGQPKLYILHLQLLRENSIIDELLPVRFGFREFKVEGRHFMLNGVRLNLKPCAYWGLFGNWFTTEAIRHWIRNAMKLGYNYVYTDAINNPGRPDLIPHFLDICDEEGMLVGVDTLPVNGMFEAIFQKPVEEQWLRVVSHAVVPNVNHPSVVMWRMNMNARGYGQDQNPYYLDGKKDFAPDSDAAVATKGLLRSNELVKALDPTRPTYNHACGRIGELYTLNNYLGWPEIQDLREWLKVWVAEGSKPLFMVEQATPYPGDFQMRDPTHWWRNEPLMTEYGAICLGDRAYELEKDEFVDVPATHWQPDSRTWRSLYTYYTYRFPPIVDECSAAYYEAMLPAWRTWGISGGVNAWENAFRRVKKQKNGQTIGMPEIPVPIDWKNLQRPGFVYDRWRYDEGGGGEIRSLFDRGLPEEEEFFEPTLRATVMPKLIAPLYAYIGGPETRWYTVEHAFRAGESFEKTIICINDRRKEAAFDIRWSCRVGDAVVASGKGRVAVPPGEVRKLSVKLAVPELEERQDAVLQAVVTVDGEAVNVKDFMMEFHPKTTAAATSPTGWVLYDPEGQTAKALLAIGIDMPVIATSEELPTDCRGLVIGCKALEGDVRFEAFDRRVREGLRVIVFEQSAATLQRTFGLRTLASGLRSVNIRAAGHPALKGIRPEDLKDWRGETSLEPLTMERPDLLAEQRFIGDHHVWRCSLEGVVASTVVEKPHAMGCIPLLDAGFDLRYMALWETTTGKGSMLFCQLDVTDRAGKEPAADRLLRNVVEYMATRGDAQAAQLVDEPSAANSHDVFLLKRDTAFDTQSLKAFMDAGGVVIVSGAKAQPAAGLAMAFGFAVKEDVRWKNALSSAALPPELRGVSPAEVHWRDRRTVPVVTAVPSNGWKSPSGVLAVIPVGKGRMVWLSGCPEDFSKEERPDLGFTHVNSVRLITMALANAGVQVGPEWASFITKGVERPKEAEIYVDTRTEHDDPYANMRW